MTGKAHIPAPSDWQPGRETFAVAALFEREAADDNPWLDYRWRLLGVLCGDQLPEAGEGGHSFSLTPGVICSNRPCLSGARLRQIWKRNSERSSSTRR